MKYIQKIRITHKTPELAAKELAAKLNAWWNKENRALGLKEEDLAYAFHRTDENMWCVEMGAFGFEAAYGFVMGGGLWAGEFENEDVGPGPHGPIFDEDHSVVGLDCYDSGEVFITEK